MQLQDKQVIDVLEIMGEQPNHNMKIQDKDQCMINKLTFVF